MRLATLEHLIEAVGLPAEERTDGPLGLLLLHVAAHARAQLWEEDFGRSGRRRSCSTWSRSWVSPRC